MRLLPERYDTLFVRLMLLQVLTALGIMILLAGLIYVDRSRNLGALTGQRWLPALRAASGLPPGAHDVAQPLMRSPTLPQGAWVVDFRLPRAQALLDTLQAGGVTAQALAYSSGVEHPTVWIAIEPPGKPREWLAFSDPISAPRLPQRILLALVLGLALLAAAGWLVARRLARPLERLREQLLHYDPERGVDSGAAPLSGSGVEVAAIETAWQAMQARLALHDRERSLLLAGISHDLRSPLARIQIAAELLPDEPAIATRRDTIVRNTVIADKLIESFLDHVRAGELPLDQRADLSEIARAVIRAMARSETELSLQAPPSLPLQHTHPLLLERVLHNLIDNAFLHGRPPVELHVSANPAGEVQLKVIDHGEGLPPGAEPYLTQAFARADPSRQQAGTGLGLAVVARIAHRMGAQLSFERSGAQHAVCMRWPARDD